jgi:uncharacterized protein (TIGR03083 family)
MMTATPALEIAPIGRDESFALTQVAIARELEVLNDLTADEWTRPTVCTAWDVRQIVLHQIASAVAMMKPLEGLAQMRAGKKLEKSEGLAMIDGFMQAGERRYQHLSAEAALEELTALLPRYAKHRRRYPQPLRSLVRMPAPGGSVTVGYLYDRVINRDHFMHRLDICDATGRTPVVTADHDGRIVEDVVQDWAARHGQPFEVTLTGPAGGSWTQGQGGQHIEMDALDFARVLSGRGTGEGLLATQVLF